MPGTGFRNRHKVGDWLVMDDESGFVHYRSQVRMIWNGTYRRKSMFETRQPQEFVRAKKDPRALTVIRPEPLVEVPTTSTFGLVGETAVPTPSGPASHLFPPGLGEMVIEAATDPPVFKVS